MDAETGPNQVAHRLRFYGTGDFATYWQVHWAAEVIETLPADQRTIGAMTGLCRTLGHVSHRGTERERQRSRREGSWTDFLGWRARESWPPLVVGWFLLPPASLIGAGRAVRGGDATGALELLAIGVVPLIWLFLPVLTRRYVIRRDQPDH